MSLPRFLTELEQLFKFNPGTLESSAVIEDTPGWSSLTFMGLIAMVDEAYQVALKPRQIHGCITFADLHALIKVERSRRVGSWKQSA